MGLRKLLVLLFESRTGRLGIENRGIRAEFGLLADIRLDRLKKSWNTIEH